VAVVGGVPVGSPPPVVFVVGAGVVVVDGSCVVVPDGVVTVGPGVVLSGGVDELVVVPVLVGSPPVAVVGVVAGGGVGTGETVPPEGC